MIFICKKLLPKSYNPLRLPNVMFYEHGFELLKSEHNVDYVFGPIEDLKWYTTACNYNDKSFFDLKVSYYMPFLKDKFINFKNSYFKQVCQLNESDLGKFCKSDSGYKLWSGQILDEGGLSIIRQKCQPDDLMFLADKQICFNRPELRFWIVNSKIVTYSKYYGNITPNPNHYQFNVSGRYVKNAKKFVMSLIDEWEPADKYVIDVLPSDYKVDLCQVVEYNCFGSSGFSKSTQISKIINSLK